MDFTPVTGSLLDAYLSALARNADSWHIPGHKRRTELFPILVQLLKHDIPLLGGIDDMDLSGGFLEAAERRLAAQWGASAARFITAGGSQANHAALCLARQLGHSHAYVSRTSHRSVIAGIILSDMIPTWINPPVDPVLHIPLPIAASEISAVLKSKINPFLVVTQPGYFGEGEDLTSAIADAQEGGACIFVDQAWGSHFAFGPPMPSPATKQGASIVTTSLHKSAMGYSQASAILIGSEIDSRELNKAVDLFNSTSPSGTVLASIDASTQLGDDVGDALAHRIAHNAILLTHVLEARVPGLVMSTHSKLFDPARVILNTMGIRRDGRRVADALREQGIEFEAAYAQMLVPMVSWADDEESIIRLADALGETIEKCPEVNVPPLPTELYVSAEAAMRPRRAFFADSVRVEMVAAVGGVSAEIITAYPPGVPILVPGELVTREVMEAIKAAQAAGIRFAHLSDPSADTLLIVAKPD